MSWISNRNLFLSDKHLFHYEFQRTEGHYGTLERVWKNQDPSQYIKNIPTQVIS